MQGIDSNTLAALLVAAAVLPGLGQYVLRFLFERNVKSADRTVGDMILRIADAEKALADRRVEHEKLYGRLKVLETEREHDKEFRTTMAPLLQEIPAIRAALEHLAKSMDEAFARINAITDRAQGASRRRSASK